MNQTSANPSEGPVDGPAPHSARRVELPPGPRPTSVPGPPPHSSSAEALRFAERVIATSPHVVYVYDLAAGRLVYVGGQLLRLLGYTADHLLSLDRNQLASLAHPDDVGPLAAALARLDAAPEGAAVECEWRARHADGSWRWLRSRETAFDRGPDGRLRQSLGWAEDVTDRRTRDSRFRAIFESSAVAVCQTDPATCRFLDVNHAMSRFTGYSTDELLRMTFLEITHPEDRDLGRTVVARLQSGETVRETVEKRYIHKDGRVIWAEVAATAVPDAAGRPATTIAVILDVTGRRATADALRSLNDTLESRVRDRTAALIESREKLRTLARELARAEHRARRRLAGELHDHLAQLLAVCQLKLVELNIGLPPGAAGAAGEIEATLGRAMEYTRTLMTDLSPPVLQARDLHGAVRWLADRMREHALDVRVRDDGRAKPLDDEALALAFETTRELLFNVIKHARTLRADVRLRVRPAALARAAAGATVGAFTADAAGDVAEVRVTDAGAGFDPSAVPKAPGRRGGFGLFTARERLALLGGRLDVRSKRGRGTVVTVVVPLKAAGVVKSEDGAPPVAHASLELTGAARRERGRRAAAEGTAGPAGLGA